MASMLFPASIRTARSLVFPRCCIRRPMFDEFMPGPDLVRDST